MRSPFVQRVDDEPIPAGDPSAVSLVSRGRLEDRDRLVDTAEHRVLLLEDLHRHVWMLALGLEQALGEHEIRVRVIAAANPIDGETEDLGVEARRDRG